MNPDCITSSRILASYYLYNKDYEAASETARSSIEALRKLRDDAGLIIPAPETALLITLATSLIHYQAPKHHPQANKLFDAILTRKPDSIDALVGKGRVALEAENLHEALEYTGKALEINPSNVHAKMEHAWALVLLNDIETGKKELEETLPLIDGRDPHSRDTIAEIYWRIGKCHWDQGRPLDILTQTPTAQNPTPLSSPV
jgi:superkiller protein 3